MRLSLATAALTALLTGGLAAHAAGVAGGAPVRYAQLNSSGDGLDGRPASREGNARPGERGSAGPRGMTRSKAPRKRSRM